MSQEDRTPGDDPIRVALYNRVSTEEQAEDGYNLEEGTADLDDIACDGTVLDAFPDAGTYRGHEEVLEFWQAWRDTFRGFRLHLGECVAVGEHHVLATFRVSGEGAGSGVGVESPAVFQLGEVRDGQVIWVEMFSTESEALEAAGLRE